MPGWFKPQRLGEFEYSAVKRLSYSRTGDVIRRVTPHAVRRYARSVLAAPTLARMASGAMSFLRLIRMNANPGSADRTAVGVPVRLKSLDGRDVLLRPGTTDVAVARNLFVSFPHVLAHEVIDPAPRRIWDLGAHIGLASAHYAVLYPTAHIAAVELERTNAQLCRRNLSQFGHRCEVVEAAVWTSSGEVTFTIGGPDGAMGTNAFRGVGDAEGNAGGRITAPAILHAPLLY